MGVEMGDDGVLVEHHHAGADGVTPSWQDSAVLVGSPAYDALLPRLYSHTHTLCACCMACVHTRVEQ